MTDAADDTQIPPDREIQESPDAPAYAGDEPAQDKGGWSQRITTAILLLAMLGLLVEIGIWAWDRLTTYGPGDAFPAIDVVSLEEGAPHTWEPATAGGTPATLLVLFTTTCPVCQGNVPGWNVLHAEVSSEVRVIGLSLDPLDRTRRFVDGLGVRFPVEVVADPEAFKEEISLPGVPLTLVLDAGGGLVEYWYGPLGSELRETIKGRLVELAPELSSKTPIEPTASRRRDDPWPGHPTRAWPLPGAVHLKANRTGPTPLPYRNGAGGLDEPQPVTP